MNTKSRAVIVTGGSRGLGLGIVQDLLATGYAAVTCSRSRTKDIERLAAQHTDRMLWLACDAGNEDQETAFFAAAMDWMTQHEFYGLINNAGVAAEGVLATFPARNLERVLSVNLLSALRLSRLALRVLLAKTGGGRIINISSIVGQRGYSGLAAYSASKAGMDGLTRSLAREVGRRRITVNSVAPGYLETALSGSLTETQRKQLVKRTPIGRLGAVSDVVPLIRFLLSDDAAFITGQTLVVDGGITC